MPFVDRPLIQLTLVRFREFLRTPEAVFWTFLFPILLAIGLGVAFRSRPLERPHIGIVGTMQGAGTILKSLHADSSLVVDVLPDRAAERALRTGRIALLVVPHGKDVEYRFDPARREAITARLITDRAIQHGAGRTDPVPIVERKVSERGSRYIDFVIPGLLGMNLMGSGIWGIAFSIVDARGKKLLKRLMATPMSRVQYLMSFVLSRLFWLILEVVTLVGFGAFVFKVPVRGSLGALAAICLLSALSFGALGLLVSSRVRTVDGVSGLTNLVMFPMWIFSGVFFSSANFPRVFQPVIHALPLTAVNDALRANMLEGASLASVGGEMAIIAAWLVVSFVTALAIFRWR
jgi:ABC-2 type transport system permease protein